MRRASSRPPLMCAAPPVRFCFCLASKSPEILAQRSDRSRHRYDHRRLEGDEDLVYARGWLDGSNAQCPWLHQQGRWCWQRTGGDPSKHIVSSLAPCGADVTEATKDPHQLADDSDFNNLNFAMSAIRWVFEKVGLDPVLPRGPLDVGDSQHHLLEDVADAVRRAGHTAVNHAAMGAFMGKNDFGTQFPVCAGFTSAPLRVVA